MMMNAKTLASTFAALQPQQQASFLARCAHALTLDARDTYIPGTEGIADPVRLRGFNEIQHRLSMQLAKILDGEAARYPDEIFLGILLEAIKQLRAHFLRAEIEKIAHEHAAGTRTRKVG